MRPHTPPPAEIDPKVLAAWQQELRAASAKPWLLPLIAAFAHATRATALLVPAFAAPVIICVDLAAF